MTEHANTPTASARPTGRIEAVVFTASANAKRLHTSADPAPVSVDPALLLAGVGGFMGSIGKPGGKDERGAQKKLPETGEVGSEGGSYADATYQVAELEGDLGREAGAVEPKTDDAQTKDAVKYPNEA